MYKVTVNFTYLNMLTAIKKGFKKSVKMPGTTLSIHCKFSQTVLSTPVLTRETDPNSTVDYTVMV